MIGKVIAGVIGLFTAGFFAWLLYQWHLADREYSVRPPKEIDDETP